MNKKGNKILTEKVHSRLSNRSQLKYRRSGPKKQNIAGLQVERSTKTIMPQFLNYISQKETFKLNTSQVPHHNEEEEMIKRNVQKQVEDECYKLDQEMK